MADFGKIIRKMRDQHSISQRDLAARIGVDFTYISKIENQVESPPSEEIIIKIAEVFGVDKYDLIIYAGKVPSDFAFIIRTDEEVQRMLKQKTAARHNTPYREEEDQA